MFKPSTTLTSLRELLAGSKTDKVKRQGDLRGWTLPWRIQAAPQSNPANSEILPSTANGVQERSNGLGALLHAGAGVHRMRRDLGIVSEANAFGKAEGSADGDTRPWTIEGRVGAKTS